LALAGGKRLRPLCALLGAQAAGFHDPCRITVATVGELLHTATLLHDDVIDEGEFRRGRPAARLHYGNGMAVLAGDFCLARGLQAIASTGHLEAVRTLSDAVTRMAEGEVAQLMIAGDASLDRQRYEMVIDRKTAALIAWCTSVGGLVDTAYVGPLRSYGHELGYAFQISDDVIDYVGDVSQSGKSRGQDLREGKMTLPLLLACEADTGLHTVVRRALAAGPPIDDAVAEHVVETVVTSAALDGCREIAHRHADQAVAALASLPGSAARDALEALAHYVVRRSS
jgi:octaprenyl-diphosphate synthase